MTLWLIALAAAAALIWYATARRRDVRAAVDLEATHDHFHAHVSLDGYLVSPGDEVRVWNTPDHIPFGTTTQFDTHATVRQASWLRRQITKVTGTSEVRDLYDVGFEG